MTRFDFYVKIQNESRTRPGQKWAILTFFKILKISLNKQFWAFQSCLITFLTLPEDSYAQKTYSPIVFIVNCINMNIWLIQLFQTRKIYRNSNEISDPQCLEVISFAFECYWLLVSSSFRQNTCCARH